MRAEPSAWAGDLARPVPLAAAAALALNDHLLKGSGILPGEVTGKLSDLAGLFVAGIAAVAVMRGVCVSSTGALPRRDGWLATAIVALVGAVFAALKLSPAFNAAVEDVWGVNALDASDLYCLPVLLLSLVWLRDRELRDQRPRRFVSAVSFAGVLVVCAATPRAPPVPPPPVPMWSVPSQQLELACGTATAWVSKSGKTGMGLTVKIVPRADDQPCDATIASTLRFADAAVPGVPIATKPLGEIKLDEDRRREPVVAGTTYHYIAFEFDNEARWNRGDRTASLELAITAAGELRATTLAATHARTEFPRERW